MNTSVKNFQIVPFPGFYQGIYDINEYLYIHEKEEAEYFGVDSIEEDVDYTFERDRLKMDIAKAWVEYMEKEVFNVLDIDLTLTNVDVWSPTYYNYATDEVYCDVQCRNFKSVMRKILALMDKNMEKLVEIIYENHTSYDGFMSFMYNNFSDWREYLANPKNYTDKQFNCYFSYILTYLLMIEKNPNASIKKQANDLTYEFISFAEDYYDFYEYITYNDEFWERCTQNV